VYFQDEREAECPEEDVVSSVFNVHAPGDNGPMWVTVQVNGKTCRLLVDTGSPYTLMGEEHFEDQFPGTKLQRSTRRLHVYGGEKLKVLGECLVDVQYQKQQARLPIVVVSSPGESAPHLLGREWLMKLRLDWPTILKTKGMYATSNKRGTQTTDERLKQLKAKYADVLAPGLGTVKGVKATLHVKEDARPVFHKARPVPFALRSAVDAELRRMQDEGVIYPVDYSEWATPLVCVPKSDGTVRLCGDYKVTVNQVLHTDQHPIPTPEEVLAKIAGGQKFSKIDLKCAYQQLVLDDKSQELVTINTSRGLFRYTRLPFGTSSSPAIWQRFIDQVLQGLDSVCVIQDDVLVTGDDDDNHIANLENVLQRFQKFGLRLKPEKCKFL
jgi:hypothetical protein